MPDAANTLAHTLEVSADALAGAVPKTLDDIIRRHRDIAHCHLSTADELEQFVRTIPVTSNADVTGELSNWRFITYRVAPPNASPTTHIHLLGDKGAESWITSPILSVDLGTRHAVTASGSVYRMVGERGAGEPPLRHLLQVCAAFWKWGRGATLDVLYVF